MNSNNVCPTCGSSTSGSVVSGSSNRSTASGSVVSGTSNRSSTFDLSQSSISFNDIINEQQLENQCRQQEIKENELDQQRLDLDVILSGFPVKPVCEPVVHSFLSIHKIPIENVSAFFQFENKTSYKSFYHIVITFVDKSSKAELFKARNKLGRPVRWNQVSGTNFGENNPIIKFNSRFSKFNLGVEKQLHRLKHCGIIAEHKYRNVFYCFKQTPASEWKDVSTDEDLDNLTDLLEFVKFR